ncbi:MAG: NTP transferase domain-containing protein [Gemmatimonadota bacterium]
MRAIILAAGVGARLAADGEEAPPKCLLRFGGRTLLDRHLENLRAVSVEEVTVVVGYRADEVEEELRALSASSRTELVYNSRYREGSVLSLRAAAKRLTDGGDVLLMDADILCDDRLLRPLFRTGWSDLFLLDRELEPGEEPVKLCVRQGALVELRKKIDRRLAYDFAGESVGFFRFSEQTARRLAARSERYLEEGRTGEPHEEVLRDELIAAPPGTFGWEEVTGIPWIEIDFPADVRRAEREILPALRPTEETMG